MELTAGGVELIEGVIGQLPNPPERMVGWDSLLLTTHQQLSSCPIVAEVARFFSEVLNDLLAVFTFLSYPFINS